MMFLTIDACMAGHGCQVGFHDLDRDGSWVRVTPRAAAAAERGAIVALCPAPPVVVGRRYALSLVARADGDRTIELGVTGPAPPWTDLGLEGGSFRQVSLGAAIRPFYFEIVAGQTLPGSKIVFHLGGSDLAVELGRILLTPIHESSFSLSGT